ncbi:hypothetical protein [Nocardia mikamii]|uniref:hypothetical protein n=1 Tax=Nocardia mikamii TaxID=508464 RepID=UPI0007A448D1|nr:hypothetical protein [Nocardia mikamii]
MNTPSGRRRRVLAVVAFAAVLAISGIAVAHVATGTAAAHPGSATVGESTTVAAQPISPNPLAQQMRDAILTAEPGSQVGIDVVDTVTGTSLAGLNTDQQFYTASVVKLLIALDELKSGNWQPDSDTAAQLSQMLSASDDDIADALWDTRGGPDIVSRVAADIGLDATRPPQDPAQWGETLTTAADVVRIYRYIGAEIPQPARDLILTALHRASATAADGTDQYFGIPDALTGTDWAIKQGWMTTDDSTTLNTTGLVSTDPAQPGRYVVVVLTTQPAGTAWTTGGAAVTALRQTLAATSAVAAASTETVTCSKFCAVGDK